MGSSFVRGLNQLILPLRFYLPMCKVELRETIESWDRQAQPRWTDLTSVCRILRERCFPDHVETETVYFISSLPNDADRLLSVIRSHWTVENQLHWVLDVQFREDDARIRVGDGAENMAVVRHMALNILKRDTSKGSLRVKRYRAAMNTAFLESLLSLV